MKYLLLWVLLGVVTVQADEFGIRLGSAIANTDTSLVSFPAGNHGESTEGKMITGLLDYDVSPNVYLEAVGGYRTDYDLWDIKSLAFEFSPGFKVQAGYFVMKLSEGLSWQPGNHFNAMTWEGYRPLNWVTHITFGLCDPVTGIGIYLDRSHYSTGEVSANPGFNYMSFSVMFPL